MKYLHTMVRVNDLAASLDFYCRKLGLEELRRTDNDKGRFTLVFLAAPGQSEAQIELTHNWDPETLGEGRNFGHLAYEVDDIYAFCERLMRAGVTINRPPPMGAWPSSARPTISRSSFCRRARRCRPASRGPRCRTRGSGDRSPCVMVRASGPSTACPAG